MYAAQNGRQRQLADPRGADFARGVIQVNLDAGDGSARAGVHLDPAAAVCSGTKQRDPELACVHLVAAAAPAERPACPLISAAAPPRVLNQADGGVDTARARPPACTSPHWQREFGRVDGVADHLLQVEAPRELGAVAIYRPPGVYAQAG
ncbi:hypothetical protein WMF38_27900 [Sorangium sp. So ce118]